MTMTTDSESQFISIWKVDGDEFRREESNLRLYHHILSIGEVQSHEKGPKGTELSCFLSNSARNRRAGVEEMEYESQCFFVSIFTRFRY